RPVKVPEGSSVRRAGAANTTPSPPTITAASGPGRPTGGSTTPSAPTLSVASRPCQSSGGSTTPAPAATGTASSTRPAPAAKRTKGAATEALQPSAKQQDRPGRRDRGNNQTKGERGAAHTRRRARITAIGSLAGVDRANQRRQHERAERPAVGVQPTDIQRGR